MKKNILIVLLFACCNALAQNAEFGNPNKFVVDPQPCKAFAHLQFELTSTDTVTLQVFNRWGETLETFFNKTVLPIGKYSIYCDTDSLKTATYYVALIINSTKYFNSLAKIETLLDTVKSQDIDTINRIHISPNPCEAFTRINFSIAKKDTVSLQVYNTMGVSIHSFFNKSVLPKGSYDLLYNTEPLQTGAYLVALKINEMNFASKLLKVNTIAATVNARSANNLKVFPNPLKQTINIDCAGVKKMEIRNMEGKTVLQMQTTSTSIDLSALPNGVYWLQVLNESNEIISHQKIMKGE